MISNIFHILLYQPLLNTLVFFYNTIAFQDLGLAIIFLTILIRIILFPFFHKGTRHQAVMQAMQPKVKEIQKKHKEDRVKQTEEIMALYKKEGVNPFSSIGFLIIQIPVLIALYRIFLQGVTPDTLVFLYNFVGQPGTVNHSFLGLIDLSQRSILIVAIAAVAQYIQGWLMLRTRKKTKDEKSASTKDRNPLLQMEKMGRSMVFIAPIITFLIFMNLPAAVSLYWLVTSVFSVFQQMVVQRTLRKEENGTMGTIH